jgi:hypothetical protein
MKKITVDLPNDLLAEARRYADKNHTTFQALAVQGLRTLMGDEQGEPEWQSAIGEPCCDAIPART